MADNGASNTEAKVQELVAKYKNLKKENEKLRTQILALRELHNQMEEANKSMQNQLSNALLLKSVVLSEGDKNAAKKVIQSMIKEVDRCIHYLYK